MLQLRSLDETDYAPLIAVLDLWWGGRRMTAMLPRLFFAHFRDTSFAAEADGTIVGFLVGFVSQTRSDEAYIHFVGVHPDYRQQGVGAQLYQRFFAAARALGCKTVRCVTSPVNQNYCDC